MALSDDLLVHPARLTAVRQEIAALVTEVAAVAGFLVDEDGAPFATVGHVEFRLPHPLSSLREGDSLLTALVGERPSDRDEGSRFVVEHVGKRALLALLVESPLTSTARRRIKATSKAIARLL